MRGRSVSGAADRWTGRHECAALCAVRAVWFRGAPEQCVAVGGQSCGKGLPHRGVEGGIREAEAQPRQEESGHGQGARCTQRGWRTGKSGRGQKREEL